FRFLERLQDRGTMTLAIETRQLTRFFGDVCAVDAVDLKVDRGTFYGFLGPNVARKSTTIKMLTGLLAASDGEILVLGKRIRDPRHVGRLCCARFNSVLDVACPGHCRKTLHACRNHCQRKTCRATGPRRLAPGQFS